MSNQGKHLQSLSEARQEARLDIPLNREVFYDFTKMEIDDECGQLYPNSIVEYGKTRAIHSVEEMARWINVLISSGIPVTVVEAEKCESSRLHFVRILHLPGYGPLSREYIWDQSH